MPEIPDIELYLSCLRTRIVGETLMQFSVRNPYVVRSVNPATSDLIQKKVTGLHRIAKRIVLEFSESYFLVLHLMIAGRLRWGDKPIAGKISHASLQFPCGFLTLTESSTKKRASLCVVQGKSELAAHDPGGINPTTASKAEIVNAVTCENRTLKRALTNQKLIAGIGNAYSDEILHRARLSPLKLSQSLSASEQDAIGDSVVMVLKEWTQKLSVEFSSKFPGPGEVTAFRPDFAVHGRYGLPCPDCGAKVQRIRYADNETNYCARCQNEDRILADRSLSRLLKDDWPKMISDLD